MLYLTFTSLTFTQTQYYFLQPIGVVSAYEFKNALNGKVAGGSDIREPSIYQVQNPPEGSDVTSYQIKQ